MGIGETIVGIRQSKRLKQKDLADLTEIPVTVLSKIENNKREPSMKHLRKLSEALKIPYEVLMLLSLDPKSIPTEKKESFDSIISLINDTFIEELSL